MEDSKALTHLSAIFDESDIIEIRCLLVREGRPTVAEHFWTTRSGFREIESKLAALNRRDFSIYYGANPRDHVDGRKDIDVTRANCFTIDIDDDCTPEQLLERVKAAGLPKPTVVIATGGGSQAQWRLLRVISAAEWTLVQKDIIAAVPESDVRIHNPSRVMRLAGFKNRKEEYTPNHPEVIIAQIDTSLAYDPDEFHFLASRRQGRSLLSSPKMQLAAGGIDDFLSRVQGVRPTGNGFQACCPAHDDKTPSLSIAEAEDGRVLVKCHAGCKTEDIISTAGVSFADLAPRRYASADEALAVLSQRLGRASKIWDYQDASGELVGKVVRWDKPDGKKQIRPLSRHPDGWVIGGMPEPRPLFRLPELAEASVVYVVEGEKAAGAACFIGLTATTSAHGSNGAEQTDWTPLAGKSVVILPDNDPSGQKYAQTVGAILRNLSPPAEVRIIDLPDLPEGGDIADLAAKHAPEKLRELVEKLVAATPPAEGLGDSRPALRVKDSEKPAITDAALELISNDLYQNGGVLVRLVGGRILPITVEAIDDLLNRRIRFTKRVRQGEIEIGAPAWLSKNILKLQHWPAVLPLEGIQRGPFFRLDGSLGGLLPGYDPSSRCYVDTLEDWSLLLNAPTETEVNDAVRLLKQLVSEFPFAHESSLSSWLACVLTRFARPAICGPVPLFVINATTPGSGKTLLAKLAGVIADDEEPGMSSLTGADEENRKAITSMLMEGANIIVFDNVDDNFAATSLNRFLTASVWKDRLLGANLMTTVANGAVTILTANNVGIQNETMRRSLRVMLAPRVERPQYRTFTLPNILAHVKEQRREYVIAAIRILQWHISRGRPRAMETPSRDSIGDVQMLPVHEMGSFEAWSELVRHALIGVGLTDPVLSIMEYSPPDEELEAFGAFLAALQEWKPSWRGTTKRLIDLVFSAPSEIPRVQVNLRSTILQVVGEADGGTGRPSPQALGNKFRRHEGRIFGGLRIVNTVQRDSEGVLWSIEGVAGVDALGSYTASTPHEST